VKYQDAEKILAEDMPVIPLWFGKLQGAWSDKVNEPAFNWQGRVDLPSLSLK
jgi:oligopeptide transport system substrate-binding protein